MLRVLSILRRLPVLAHQDHGSLNRSQTREKEVEEDIWIRVERARSQDDAVEHHPGDQSHKEDNDERPASAECGHAIGQTLPERQRLFEVPMDMPTDANPLRD